MLKSDIIPKTEYVFREKRQAGTPVQRVRILEHVRGNKWKAQWIDPNPGLVDYIESGQLLVPWKQHKAFLKEESHAAELQSYNRRHGFEGDTPIVRSVEQVFASAGEQSVSFYHGLLSGPPEAIDRIRVRAGVPSGNKCPWAYVDRAGVLHLPLDEALELARSFCAREPAPVLAELESTEREWSAQASRPGEEYIIPLLNEYRASWAILRQWTGHDPAIAAREAQIQKLERLVWDAIYALQKAGLDNEAAKLRRVLDKG